MTIDRKLYNPIVLFTAFILAVVFLFLKDPIPQDLLYHSFSDQRTIWGLPHFFDVVSNLPFLIVGLLGFKLLINTYKNTSRTNLIIASTLFGGVFLTGLGSAFYHHTPNNFTLIFDRLPMTLVFTSFFATIVYDYIGSRAGKITFYTMLALGVYSIVYWYSTELNGAGDLRLYAFIQFFPIVVIPIILLLYKNKNMYTKRLLYVFGAYMLAKLCEHFDGQLHEIFSVVSGHTIKHLFSALAIYYIYQIYKKRLCE